MSDKPSASLQQLFQQYLGEDDSLEGVQISSSHKSPTPAHPPSVVPDPKPVPAATPQQQQPAPAGSSLQNPAVGRVWGVFPFWTSVEAARKTTGPQHVHSTWLEVLYDFICAFAIGSVGYGISSNWPAGKWMNFVQIIIILRVWHDNAQYMHQFYSQDGLSKFFIFLQLLGVLGMSMNRNALQLGEDTFLAFAISFLWARLFTVLLYALAIFSKTERPTTRIAAALSMALILLTTVPMIVTLFLANDADSYFRTMLWLIGIGVDHLFSMLLPLMASWEAALPIVAPKHYKDRIGTLVIGVMIYLLHNVMFFDTTCQAGPCRPEVWALVGLHFLVGFGFIWLYFDGDNGAHAMPNVVHAVERSPVARMLWTYLSMTLVVGLSVVGDAANQFINLFRGISAPRAVLQDAATGAFSLTNTVHWIYGVTFGLCIIIITLTGLLHRYDHQPMFYGKVYLAVIKFGLALALIIVPVAGLDNANALAPLLLPIMASVFLFFLVVLDWLKVMEWTPLLPESARGTVAGEAPPATGVSSAAQEQQIAALRQGVAERDETIAALRAEMAKGSEGVASAAVVSGKGKGEEVAVESQLSESHEWQWTSATSSVIEEVDVGEDDSFAEREAGDADGDVSSEVPSHLQQSHTSDYTSSEGEGETDSYTTSSRSSVSSSSSRPSDPAPPGEKGAVSPASPSGKTGGDDDDETTSVTSSVTSVDEDTVTGTSATN